MNEIKNNSQQNLREIIILLLLDHFHEIKGKTRLIKYLFLLQKEGDLGLNLEYIPHYFGPYSQKVDDVLTNLKQLNLVFEYLDKDGKTINYRLTKLGFEKIMNSEFNYNFVEKIKTVIDQYHNLTLRDLIEIIYAKYPEYTDLSKIK